MGSMRDPTQTDANVRIAAALLIHIAHVQESDSDGGDGGGESRSERREILGYNCTHKFSTCTLSSRTGFAGLVSWTFDNKFYSASM